MNSASPSPRLKPYAVTRPWRQWAALVTLAALVVAAFTAAEWDFSALTQADQRSAALARMLAWAQTFASPDLSYEFLRQCWALTLQTLAAATLGTSLAVAAGFLLAMGSSRAVCVGEEDAQGWRRNFALRGLAAVLCALCRLLQDILRAVPDFVWAIILVAMIGLGPLTGALALALNISGILAKVYSELWDSIEERDYEQIRAVGGGRLKTFFYGIRPLASRSMLSFTLMRAECAIRNAAVIGAVGGGGLGAEIWYQIQFGAWSKVTTLMLFTLALTLSADLASNFIRRQLREDPNHPRGTKPRNLAQQLLPAYVGSGFVCVVLLWSLWFMGWGDNAPPGQQSRNYLEPAVKLVTGESWRNLAFFERLLRPDLDGAALGLGGAEKSVDLFAEYTLLDFWKPSAWAAWDQELEKWFVWRVVKSASVPLAMAIIGTLMGVAGAIALTYPHSLAFQMEPARFTGETAHPLVRIVRLLQLVGARFAGLIARGVPEVMWAFLFIAFFGPGLLAGTIAIAIHSTGVLVRVFSETVDNIPYRRFEQSFMGSRLSCFGCVAAPTAWRDWLTYSFFQFESNVRTGVVLGIVGVGGLGFFFTFNFEWFRFEKAATYLLMIIALTILIDRTSRLLKLSRISR
ncbi:phosphonate transport system permease protein [Geoalkalibacter ferrihydriticus]|uniref:ABC transporter permease n=2 Tax=Geoalkalibacter ferrihydriticus TaxID=392333 RepID=A0A0C2HIH7_9BACT|nr:ABC transporter permease subunit [Geoalkalibacter ferrihydriticus]KIH76841.1 ABC transporter permease [Geoalkalibacter ferrihydriticus DSM 17813]SDL48341.1 phosphonate transport system permease protein [Geoalkalibacter ferrihydriticus]